MKLHPYLKRKQRHIFIMGLFLTTLILWTNSLAIYGKAYIAQILIGQAWQDTLATQSIQKPWPWADTWPVAKLTFSERKKSFVVLADANGQSLAFGPSHVKSSAEFEQQGTKIIGGHRDTHFSILKNIKLGETISVQNQYGNWQSYEITETKIVDSREGDWYFDIDADELHLITCYPFEAVIAGGPERFVVIAKAITENIAATK